MRQDASVLFGSGEVNKTILFLIMAWWLEKEGCCLVLISCLLPPAAELGGRVGGA